MIKVRSDAESVLTAAEQFLSKSQQERDHLIRLVVEGHLRGVIDQLSGEELLGDPGLSSAWLNIVNCTRGPHRPASTPEVAAILPELMALFGVAA